MSRRAVIAGGVLACWAGGLALFARREAMRAPAHRMAEIGLRIGPGPSYYQVEIGGKHVGFASTTIDTIPGGVRVTDYLVVDIAIGGMTHRATSQSVVRLNRTFSVQDFRLTLQADSAPFQVRGRVVGDTVLEYGTVTEGVVRDTQRIRVRAPVLLPSLIPLAIALGDKPHVGSRFTIPMFDPVSRSMNELRIRLDAESLFVLTDSARFDAGSRRWIGARTDTVRAWQMASDAADAKGDSAHFKMNGWVDEEGRLVTVREPLGITLHRMAYEMAFENWRLSRVANADGGVAIDNSAIAAGKTPDTPPRERVRLRIHDADLTDLRIAGPGQSLTGDTVTIVRFGGPALNAEYRAPFSRTGDQSVGRELAVRPGLQWTAPELTRLAAEIRGGERDPRTITERIARWVHDSLGKAPAAGALDARTVLRTRSGDCDEHTQLFVALARASGIPARSAAGLLLINGRFYYHAWAEVYLADWVPVDPTFGQFPADASHLRLLGGDLGRHAELFRLIGRAKIELVEGA
jgi:hypothetical protein